MTQRQAVTKKKALAYRSADREGKSRILTELVELTGWHRDQARAALQAALTLKIVTPRHGQAPARKRLAPMLPVLVPLLRRDGELDSDEEAALLVRMSAATIDRRLAPERATLLSREAVAYQARDAAEVADPDPHLGRRGPRVRGNRPRRARGGVSDCLCK